MNFKVYRGIIEDNNSPVKDGRVRVRIFGIHSQDKKLVPTETLPWAEFMQPLTFGYGSGIGITSIPRTGSWVFIILENDNPNNPIIIGGVAGRATQEDKESQLPKPERIGYWDVNDLANPGYPNNHVIETHAGHIIEIDDSSGTERIRICHTNGNEVLLNNKGITVSSIKDRLDLTTGKYVSTVLNTMEISATGTITINTAGSLNLTSNGPTNILANNDINVTTNGNLNVTSQVDTNILVKGNCNTHVIGNNTSIIDGNNTSTITGTSTETITGHVSITAQSGITATVTGDTSVTTSGDAKVKAGGAANLEGSTVTVKSSGPALVQGSVVTLKSNSNTMVV